ncbi:MAG: HD domain-containing protein [Anaerolineae bacterium]|nr:HD domain-containing protein [Anaerolineae bacterium]
MGKVSLGRRFDEALQYAAKLHGNQRRKGSGTPYLAHLLGVSALVLEDGGSEDEAIAGLLHDAVEDQGGMETLEEIRQRFGEDVAAIVLGCSDAVSYPKPEWRGRKEEHLASLAEASPGVRRVVLADKLYNANSLLRDLTTEGANTWKKFKGGRDGTMWYYRTALEMLDDGSGGHLLEELKQVLERIESLIKKNG